MGHMRRAPKTTSTVGELRSRIERGRYEVKPDRVAEAMLRRGIIQTQGAAPRARQG